jgi:Cytochrome b5-like Heme/Steroid binding domain
MPHAFVAGGCRVAPQHSVGTITCLDPSVCLANVPMLAPFMLQLEGALLPVLIALALVAFVAFTRRARSITTCPFKFGCGTDPSSRGMAAANGSTGVALTLVQLSQYDGRDAAKPLYLAVRGRIYDVSAGRSFYGPGAPVASRHSVSVLLVCADDRLPIRAWQHLPCTLASHLPTGGPYAVFAGKECARALAFMQVCTSGWDGIATVCLCTQCAAECAECAASMAPVRNTHVLPQRISHCLPLSTVAHSLAKGMCDSVGVSCEQQQKTVTQEWF